MCDWVEGGKRSERARESARARQRENARGKRDRKRRRDIRKRRRDTVSLCERGCAYVCVCDRECASTKEHKWLCERVREKLCVFFMRTTGILGALCHALHTRGSVPCTCLSFPMHFVTPLDVKGLFCV